jgi:hypothetical protein
MGKIDYENPSYTLVVGLLSGLLLGILLGMFIVTKDLETPPCSISLTDHEKVTIFDKILDDIRVQ